MENGVARAKEEKSACAQLIFVIIREGTSEDTTTGSSLVWIEGVTGNNRSNSNSSSRSRSRRHRHHRRIWYSPCSLRTLRATQRPSFVTSSLHHIHCVLVSWKRCPPRLSLPSCSSLCSGRYFLSRGHALIYNTMFHNVRRASPNRSLTKAGVICISKFPSHSTIFLP